MPNFKQVIDQMKQKEIAEDNPNPQPKEEKTEPRGFVRAEDGKLVPKEYSDDETNEAYFGASRYFRKTGNGPEEFLAANPGYNADAVYAAYKDAKAGNEWQERRREKEEVDRFEKDIGNAKTQSDFDRIKKEVDAAFENQVIGADQKDALYDKIPAELYPLPLFGEKAMRAVEKKKSQDSDVKSKVEGLLGRKFSEEEWKTIVELANSTK